MKEEPSTMTSPAHVHEWERGSHMAEAFGVDGRKPACAICGIPKPEPTPSKTEHELEELLRAVDWLDEVAPTLWQQPKTRHDPSEPMQLPIRQRVKAIRDALPALLAERKRLLDLVVAAGDEYAARRGPVMPAMELLQREADRLLAEQEATDEQR